MVLLLSVDVENSIPTISEHGLLIISELGNNKGNLAFFNLKFDKVVQINDISYHGGIIFIHQSDFYFWSSESSYSAFNAKNGNVRTVLEYGDYSIDGNFENKFILSELPLFSNKDQVTNKSRKMFYADNHCEWETDIFGRIFIYEDIIICYSDPNPSTVDRKRIEFSKLNYQTGKQEWYFNLGEHKNRLLSTHPFDQPHQVKEPLGVFKDQLWFSMSNYGLLCLNNNTGEFMHYLRDCPENPAGHIYLPYGGYPVIPFTENAVLLAEEGKIVCFDNMFYWQLDLETLELDFHFLEDYFKEVDCYTFRTRFKKLIVEGRKIYMVASKSNKFACFNRDTLKYDWIESLPENSGSPRSIEKHGNKLYIDTSKKELLVYEM